MTFKLFITGLCFAAVFFLDASHGFAQETKVTSGTFLYEKDPLVCVDAIIRDRVFVSMVDGKIDYRKGIFMTRNDNWTMAGNYGFYGLFKFDDSIDARKKEVLKNKETLTYLTFDFEKIDCHMKYYYFGKRMFPIPVFRYDPCSNTPQLYVIEKIPIYIITDIW